MHAPGEREKKRPSERGSQGCARAVELVERALCGPEKKVDQHVRKGQVDDKTIKKKNPRQALRVKGGSRLTRLTTRRIRARTSSRNRAENETKVHGFSFKK